MTAGLPVTSLGTLSVTSLGKSPVTTLRTTLLTTSVRMARAVARARLWLAAAVAAGVLICGGAAPQAHEIGTTTVTVSFRPASADHAATYRIDVGTDAEALIEKLEAMSSPASPARSPRSAPTAADIAMRIAALEDTFRDRVAVRFDDVAVRPRVTFAVASPLDGVSPPVATIRLIGDVPTGATRFAWSYGWTFASYALAIVESRTDGGGQDGAGQSGAVQRVAESVAAESGVVEGRSAAGRSVERGVPPATTQWLEGGEISTPYRIGVAVPRVSRLQIARQYVWLGITHIVPKGLDHVLFVLGLFLLSRRWRPLLWQVSAFTVAHSITLGLGMYGLVTAPSSVVEPLIALSIAYVAVENLVVSELKAWRVALVFTFGLLHGLGFAGVLSDLGLPRDAFAAALVGFNVGVEAGQLLVIAAAFALVGWSRAYPSYRQRVVMPASLAIACVSVYWTIERWP